MNREQNCERRKQSQMLPLQIYYGAGIKKIKPKTSAYAELDRPQKPGHF